MERSRFELLVVLIAVLAVFVFYILSANVSGKDSSELKIAASIFPVYSIASQIAGDHVEVKLILPPGVSPHTYEPTVQKKVELVGVNLAFIIGQNLDNWAVNILPDEETDIVDLSNAVNLLKDEDHHEQAVEHDQNESNPHYWLSPDNALLMARTITFELKSKDPKNAIDYDANLKIFEDSISQLKKEYAAKFKSKLVPGIITFHDAFSYLAEEFNFEIAATIEEFPGKEPGPAYLAEVGKVIKNTGVKVLYKEPQLSDAIVDAIAEDYGATVEILDPVGGTNGLDTYQQMLRSNLDKILNQ